MTELRYACFRLAFDLIAGSRAYRWLRPVAAGSGLILMFHQVRPWYERAFAPNRLLEITPEFLDVCMQTLRDMRYEIISINELPERLRASNQNRPFAVLTFDDGYRDNVQYALPVLRKHHAPWTLFVTADFAEGVGRLCWLELEQAIARLASIAVSLDGVSVELQCRTAVEKRRAFNIVYGRLRAGPEHCLRSEIARLSAQAGVDSHALTKELCLSWDELKELCKDPGVMIGAHTVSHPILAKHDLETARSEIVRSKALLEQRLGRRVHHFAYPVGNRSAAGPREFALAREAGFETAVTTRPGHVFRNHLEHLHALPRISVNGLFQTENALRALFSGIPFLAWNTGRRVNLG